MTKASTVQRIHRSVHRWIGKIGLTKTAVKTHQKAHSAKGAAKKQKAFKSRRNDLAYEIRALRGVMQGNGYKAKGQRFY